MTRYPLLLTLTGFMMPTIATGAETADVPLWVDGKPSTTLTTIDNCLHACEVVQVLSNIRITITRTDSGDVKMQGSYDLNNVKHRVVNRNREAPDGNYLLDLYDKDGKPIIGFYAMPGSMGRPYTLKEPAYVGLYVISGKCDYPANNHYVHDIDFSVAPAGGTVDKKTFSNLFERLGHVEFPASDSSCTKCTAPC